MARYCLCASRDAQEGDDRYIESGRRAKLLFDSDGEIAKASDGIVIIVRNVKAQLGVIGHAKAHLGFGTIHGALPLVTRNLETVLNLEAPLWDDGAGFGNGRTVGGNRLAAQ